MGRVAAHVADHGHRRSAGKRADQRRAARHRASPRAPSSAARAVLVHGRRARGRIPLRITNTSATPLTVRGPSRVRQADVPQPTTSSSICHPTRRRAVQVDIVARSNGVSPMTVVLRTPFGGQLTEPVVLTARVNNLTGLGRVVTVGLLLVLATWWLTYFKRRRRSAPRATRRRERHPSPGNRLRRAGRPVACIAGRFMAFAAVSVRIVTDSSCDLPQAVADELGIDDRAADDPLRRRGVRRPRGAVDRRVLGASASASPTLPETAAPAPGQFEAATAGWPPRARPASSSSRCRGALSATMQSAELAARSVGRRRSRSRVVDSRSVTHRPRHDRARVRPRWPPTARRIDEVDGARRTISSPRTHGVRARSTRSRT